MSLTQQIGRKSNRGLTNPAEIAAAGLECAGCSGCIKEGQAGTCRSTGLTLFACAGVFQGRATLDAVVGVDFNELPRGIGNVRNSLKAVLLRTA
jgi:hypothetical protein